MNLYYNLNYQLIQLNKERERRAINAAEAIAKSKFSCEINSNYSPFIRKSNNKEYTEAHHLIPLKFQKDFEYSLDVPANIVSLRSNCHNQLYYGIEIIPLLKKLYDERKEKLSKCILLIFLLKKSAIIMEVNLK